MSSARSLRIMKEMAALTADPPPGITCWNGPEDMFQIHAVVQGPRGSPFEDGGFHLKVTIPDNYPFAPPLMQFLTSIYHPNIDDKGRICLDLLKMPPKGRWAPSLTISTILISLQQLMSEPNPDDPLIVDIAEEYRSNYSLFVKKAREMTLKHACVGEGNASTLPVGASSSTATMPPPAQAIAVTSSSPTTGTSSAVEVVPSVETIVAPNVSSPPPSTTTTSLPLKESTNTVSTTSSTTLSSKNKTISPNKLASSSSPSTSSSITIPHSTIASSSTTTITTMEVVGLKRPDTTTTSTKPSKLSKLRRKH